jgi:hypothetical protein
MCDSQKWDETDHVKNIAAVFVTLDERLGEACRREGLDVLPAR